MDDMVEKVSRAVETACASAAVSSDEYCSPAMAKAAARAAIEAMREPTEAMLEAGNLPGWDDSVTVGLSGEVWQAMINVALGSKGE